ncbi:hypothetical protein WICMUC_005646 [Wickerhamomyces mucosus]|uniref:Fe2OG dioxygenase domain-containing protein n=1 Tax=Wickerhamomyces mucosus TaxID=1378264 RepID=A0A9P8T4W4_9ASCO|nr:hypothetical protein WICMUC_005646 [Wickerhamomyces mucosus]
MGSLNIGQADSVPILDLDKVLNPTKQTKESKVEFLHELQDALFNYGFFYLKNPPFKLSKFSNIKQQSLKFFNDLPLDEKIKIHGINSKHFLGYNGLGDELTASNIDWREQVEFGTELPVPKINSSDELYKNIEGPNLWPNDLILPNFKETITDYIDELSSLARILVRLIEETLNIPIGTIESNFFKQIQQAKLKIIKYPDLENLQDEIKQISKDLNKPLNINQGVGEHRDNDLLTFIYQATNHNSLQVKDFHGNWINIPPIENTLVFAVGLTLEFITQGACISTVHRVLTPIPGEGDRLSISFFQTINIDSIKKILPIDQYIKELIKKRDSQRIQNKIGFQFQVDGNKPIGYSVFLNRIKSHPKVGAKYYPEVLKYIQEEVAKASDI